jgi:hypothetical protein
MSNEDRDGAHPSDYALIRWKSGEASETEETAVHLERCERCRERSAGMDRARAAFLDDRPASDLVGALAGRARETPRSRRLGAPALAAALAACAAALVVVWVALPGDEQVSAPPNHAPGGVRLKGVAVEWVVRRGEDQRLAPRGFRFRDGDSLGFSVLAPRPLFVMVAAFDEGGRGEQLIPAPGEPALRIRPGLRTTLPSSLRLEKPIVSRRIFLLLSARPIDLTLLASEVRRTLRRERRTIRELPQLPFTGFQESRWVSLGD